MNFQKTQYTQYRKTQLHPMDDSQERPPEKYPVDHSQKTQLEPEGSPVGAPEEIQLAPEEP